ncbi:MAG: ABC transporter permease [Bacteroidales bacterium]
MRQDIAFAFRRLRSTPGFTFVAVFTLALGLAGAITMFSVVDATLLRPLPYRNADRLAQMWAVREGDFTVPYVSDEAMLEYRSHRELFTAVEGFTTRTPAMTGGREPDIVVACELTGGMMQMLGARLRLGRAITAADVTEQRRVAVLSDALWRGRFGSDSAVVGKRIELDGAPYEVVGVATQDFRFPSIRHQLWIPIITTGPAGRPQPPLEVLARLSSGVTYAQANERAGVIGRALDRARPSLNGWQVSIRPFLDFRISTSARRALIVLFGGVGLVLLIACANLANLLLAQGTQRQHELATRAALGASPGRIARQLLVENLVLALLGGASGVTLSAWAVDILAAIVPKALTFLNVAEIALDARAAAFAVAATLVTLLLFGVLPAVRSSRTPLPNASGLATRTLAGGHGRVQAAFVVAQVALSLVLLVGAGLLLRTFVHLTQIDTGFDQRNLVALDLSLPRWKYATYQAQSDLLERLLARLRTVPGVQSATLTTGIPPSGGGLSFGLRIEAEGSGVVVDDKQLVLPFTEVQADFFKVLRIPIRRGRAFSSADSLAAPRSIIVSEQMARRLWPNRDAIGQRVRLDRDAPWYTVVGVAGDVFQDDYASPGKRFAAYYPLSQATRLAGQQTLAVRVADDAAALIPAIRQAIWSVDRDQPISKVATVTQLYEEFLALPRFYALLLTVFACVGLVLSAVGLYGVLAYSMAQRTREFGVRLALGATPGEVAALLLRNAVWLTLGGLVLGIAGSMVVTRSLGALLVGVPRTDGLTYAVVALTLLLVALAACWPPARRARKVDPIVALRYE